MVVLKQHSKPEKSIHDTEPYLSFWKSVHSMVINRYNVLQQLRVLIVSQLWFFLPMEGVPITGATVHQPEVPVPARLCLSGLSCCHSKD